MNKLGILVIFINRSSHGRRNTAKRYIHKIKKNIKKNHALNYYCVCIFCCRL